MKTGAEDVLRYFLKIFLHFFEHALQTDATRSILTQHGLLTAGFEKRMSLDHPLERMLRIGALFMLRVTMHAYFTGIPSSRCSSQPRRD